MKKRLQYVDGETLASTILPPIRFVIHELLPQGLHVLAGAPKVGKSWLSLWICLCVAQGEKLWDFPTQKGSVLYLCLEDSYARIQNRLLDLTDDPRDVADPWYTGDFDQTYRDVEKGCRALLARLKARGEI